MASRSGVPPPYRVSAGLGHDILADQQSPLDLATDQVTLFERLTRYLQPTDSLRQARFLRFLRLATRGDDTDVAPDRDGVFHLKGGTTYTLELFHHQPIDVTAGEPFTIAVDDAIIRVIGRSGFDIGSRYDRIAIPMHAVQSERYEARERVLVIDPTDPVKGPQLRLQLRVDPPSKKLFAGSMASTAALGAIGFAALLPIGTLWQALIIVAAVITIAVFSFFGLYVTALAGVKIPSLTPSSAGGTPTPTPTPPAGHWLMAGLVGSCCPARARLSQT